jgi:hypothetical protein
MNTEQQTPPVWDRDHLATNERSSSHDWRCTECGRSVTIATSGREVGHEPDCVVRGGPHA